MGCLVSDDMDTEILDFIDSVTRKVRITKKVLFGIINCELWDGHQLAEQVPANL